MVRKAQKAQLLEVLQTLREAHEAVKKYIGRCELEAARALLSDCQENAFQVGGIIEESEGEDCPAVGLLEAYCEALYQASVGASGSLSAQKTYKALNKALLRVEHSVRDEIPVRLEVVFLPYKASMWDSLKSVWGAATADPNCDAFVVPIPYYDKNPDGSLGVVHYEGGMYPKDVPIVRYDLYDFEKRRPDAVFIHNGYDSFNYVTTVHPDFYSTRLKKFAARLFYIPYFISVNSVSDGMCTVPGCWYADRAFLQSEKIRREYINAFLKLGLPGGTPEILENKFVALGSPKFDEAILSKPAGFNLPEQWDALINPPGGARKKIVLYNTSIAAMLEWNEKYLDKLRTVLHAFRGHDAALLWWRPHPLCESTYRSMRPWLLDEYLQIVGDFQRGGWGIFDNSADVNRAVAFADYYFGDRGSALQASFQAAGKPVLLQNIKREAAIPHILGVSREKLYFSLLYSSAVLSLDLSTGDIEAVKAGHSTQWRPYLQGTRAGDALYFTPVAAHSILKIDLESQRVAEIPYALDENLLSRLSSYEKMWSFRWAIAYGEEVFFVGAYYPAIMCLDTRSGQITYSTDLPAAFQNEGHSLAACCCQIGREIVLGGTSRVLAYFDMAAKRFHTEEVPGECAAGGFSTLTYGDGYLWLMAKESGDILRYAPETRETAVYSQFPAGVIRCENMCSSCIYIHGGLWLFPNNTNAVLRLDVASGEIRAVRLFPEAREGEHAHVSLPVLVGGKICVSRRDYPGFSLYSPETADYTDVPIRIPSEVAAAAACGAEEYADIHETVLQENGIDSIETLLRTPARRYEKLLAEWIASPDGRAGERIYQYARELSLSGQR